MSSTTLAALDQHFLRRDLRNDIDAMEHTLLNHRTQKKICLVAKALVT